MPLDGAPEPIMLGCRPWVHFGRRPQCKKDRQPDVELFTRTASRKQAILLRNWHGQVFLMDLGSSHGTFLGRQKLVAKSPKEWKPGTMVFFADYHTESFELRPRPNLGCPKMHVIPKIPSESGKLQGPTGISGIASMAMGQFAGARRMMGAQLGEEMILRPKQAEQNEEAGEAEDKVEQIEEAAEKAELLYPGDWRVPADGLTKIGWKPEDPKEKADIVIDPPPESRTKQTANEAVQSPCALAGHGEKLGERLQQVMLERFGPKVSTFLKAKGPRYPCPEKESFQLDLISGRCGFYDPNQAVIVLVKVSAQPSVGLTQQVSLEWLHANISEHSLVARFTDAPVEIAEPSTAGYWYLDLPLKASQNKGTVSLSSFQPLPGKLFVRLCSISIDGQLSTFGSSLRPLDINRDEWSLDALDCRSEVPSRSQPSPLLQKVPKLPEATKAPKMPKAVNETCPKISTSLTTERRIELSSGTSAESCASSVRSSSLSHPSTELVSEDEMPKVPKAKKLAHLLQEVGHRKLTRPKAKRLRVR